MIVAILVGPTAVGKTALALRLAEQNGFEILSADSRQVYRGLTVGTGAPTAEESARARHHLVGFLDPAEPFSPREYPARVHAVLAAHASTRFLLVGGTGLYLKELLYPAARDRGPTPEAIRRQVQERLAQEGPQALHAELSRLDPASLAGVHPNDAYRVAKRWENHLITGEAYAAFAAPPALDPRFASVPLLWMDDDREALYARIDARVEAMVRSGWLEEVKTLMKRADFRDLPAMSSLGYREMAAVAEGTLSLAQAVEAIRKKTRNYAKRQLTFFRHQFPTAIRWEAPRLVAALGAVDWDWEAFLAQWPAGPEGSAGAGG
jgi:tRNA dimethylallyltransferase